MLLAKQENPLLTNSDHVYLYGELTTIPWDFSTTINQSEVATIFFWNNDIVWFTSKFQIDNKQVIIDI
jgi:hypothetical protein